MVDEGLKAESRDFSRIYSAYGRPSIPPGQLLRALLLQVCALAQHRHANSLQEDPLHDLGESAQRVQVREDLPVRLAGPEEDAEDGDGSLFAAGAEEEAVVADAPAKHTPPFLALERFDVALKWVGGHLQHDARDAFLNGLGNLAEVFPGVLG